MVQTTVAEDDDLMAIGIEIEPGETTPAMGVPISPEFGVTSGQTQLSDEEIAKIGQKVAQSVRDLVWDRIDHILTHAITEAVKQEFNKFKE
ncbi:MAG: hypothetical protein AB1921_09440 [Thermodesulfobacteriota bacterium]